MVKMIKNIIYVISIISLVILTILTSQMIPIIYNSSLQGLIYLISVIILLVFEIIELIISKKTLKKMYGYNILIILITIYLGIIYCAIYSNNTLNNIKYYKDNFLIMSILIGLTIISFFFVKTEKTNNAKSDIKTVLF